KDGSNAAFVSTGILEIGDQASITVDESLRLDDPAVLIEQPTGSLTVAGNLLGTTRDTGPFAAQGTILLNGGTPAPPACLERPSWRCCRRTSATRSMDSPAISPWAA